MTRKRFIRLLMAAGYSRNKAHACAWYIQSTGMPYKVAYGEMKWHLKLFQEAKTVKRSAEMVTRWLCRFIYETEEAVQQVVSDVKAAFGELYGTRTGTNAEEGDKT